MFVLSKLRKLPIVFYYLFIVVGKHFLLSRHKNTWTLHLMSNSLNCKRLLSRKPKHKKKEIKFYLIMLWVWSIHFRLTSFEVFLHHPCHDWTDGQQVYRSLLEYQNSLKRNLEIVFGCCLPLLSEKGKI